MLPIVSGLTPDDSIVSGLTPDDPVVSGPAHIIRGTIVSGLTPYTVLRELSWRWILWMAIAPLPVGGLVAWPVWRRRETVLGNIAGTVVILGTSFALIFRESTALDVAQRACFDAGFAVCTASPSAFVRYAIYASIGMAEVVALFLISLNVERRIRERDYAPQWRR
jgi:hypothetical protein